MAAVAVDVIEDEDAYAEAEAILAALSAEYPRYARADVDQMKVHLDTIMRQDGVAAADIDSFFYVAHNVKGQGAAFGYELMTYLGEEICVILRGRRALDRADQSRVHDLVAACERVLDDRLVGNGGLAGRTLLSKLSVSLPAA